MGVILKEISQEYEKQKQMSTKGLDKIFTIMNRDCQKPIFQFRSISKHIAQRGEYMTNFSMNGKNQLCWKISMILLLNDHS